MESKLLEPRSLIAQILEESIQVQRVVLEESVPLVSCIVEALVATFRCGGKVLLFGNGGSAADAQHVAAELVNRFLMERKPLPALALTTDTSIMTAMANDLGFECVFARQVEALVQPGDVVVGLSTSGNSENVLQGLHSARECGATTVGLTGRAGGKLKGVADICFCAPSDNTPRIQEAHITVLHAICEAVERELFD
ncbi:MAG TPA: D-sedoheptulose 7-phosphate isomerase [Anaerolineae bacterium]|nr:D-sedoheptulose 7-phosphate isomerase [Anaerolineae bacterium]